MTYAYKYRCETCKNHYELKNENEPRIIAHDETFMGPKKARNE